MRKYTPEQQIASFWNKVDKNGPIPEHCPELGNCWMWTATLCSGRYGNKKWNGKIETSHRVSWMLSYGDIPDNLFVLHKCDNPRCVRPSHLFLGTALDNMHDMIAKNRKGAPKNKPVRINRLTDIQVQEIRALFSGGEFSQRELARRYGISPSHVRNIGRYKQRT